MNIIIEHAKKRKVNIVTTGKRYVKSNELIWSNSLALPHPSKTLKNIFEGLLKEVDFLKEEYEPWSGNIMLMRKKGGVRSVSNYNEIVVWAESNGFKVVIAEDYSVKDQISLFAKCNTLISVHGAGMSNIVFMKKGGKVIELSPDSGYNPAIQDLSTRN